MIKVRLLEPEAALQFDRRSTERLGMNGVPRAFYFDITPGYYELSIRFRISLTAVWAEIRSYPWPRF